MHHQIQCSVFAWDKETRLEVSKQNNLPDSYVVAVGDCNLFFNHARLEEFTDMLRDYMQANPVASNALGVSVSAESIDDEVVGPFSSFEDMKASLDDEIPF